MKVVVSFHDHLKMGMMLYSVGLEFQKLWPHQLCLGEWMMKAATCLNIYTEINFICPGFALHITLAQSFHIHLHTTVAVHYASYMEHACIHEKLFHAEYRHNATMHTGIHTW